MRRAAIVVVAKVAVVAMVMALTPGTSRADSDLIFFCNYDVLFSVEETVGQVNSRARVRDGHTVPIEFQDYRIEISVAGGPDDSVKFAISMFEKSGQSWYLINPEPLSFGGTLGVPVEYRWSDGGIALDVAISVSSGQHKGTN